MFKPMMIFDIEKFRKESKISTFDQFDQEFESDFLHGQIADVSYIENQKVLY